MIKYIEYLEEIEQRKSQELDPKPIDGAELLIEIISQIKDYNHKDRKDSINFFIYNVLPGTTSAAIIKSKFLVKTLESFFSFLIFLMHHYLYLDKQYILKTVLLISLLFYDQSFY